ncbi:MAG: LacI family DNA-binding transcriptional regulator [Clostridia bacterium]|nr:LacI family DNA-binding transcriptional regulator [Clostridia bacterium]
MGNITIHDIAKKANVSPATVSYVINDRPGVSEKMRNRIRKIIEENGYNPNLSSRKLVLNKSFNIHIVMGSAFASFDNLFYNTAIKSMMEVCMHKGYNLVLSSTEDYEKSPLKRAILQKDVDGVIFLQDVVHCAVSEQQKRKIPYVVLDAHEKSAKHNSVYCDYEEAAYQAVKYLISMGHRKIGFAGMKSIAEFYESSCRGYRRALSEEGVIPEPEWMHGGEDENESIAVCAAVMGEKSRKITAVLCATDVIAVTLMKHFRQIGISVPDDISVCGMDDVLIAQYCTPSLTTIEIDKRKMGEEAIHLLISMIDGDIPSEGQNVCIHGEKVIERESVKKIL